MPLYADECTTNVDRISFARVLIELDITKELVTTVKVEDPTGRIFNQKVIYEWIPTYYPKCPQVGHKCLPTTIEQLDHKLKVQKEWQPKPVEKTNPFPPVVQTPILVV